MIDPALIYCSVCYRSKLEPDNQNLSYYVSACARILCNDCHQQQLLQNIACTKCSRSNCQKELISDQLIPNVRAIFTPNVNEHCQHKQIVQFQQTQLKSFEQYLRQQFMEFSRQWNNGGQSIGQLKAIEDERIKRSIELQNTINVCYQKRQKQQQFSQVSNNYYRNHEESQALKTRHHHHHPTNQNHHHQPNIFETSLLQTSSSNSIPMNRALNISRSSSSTNKLYSMKTGTKSGISRLPSLTSHMPNLSVDLKSNSIHDRLYRKTSPSIYSAMTAVFRDKMNPYAASRLSKQSYKWPERRTFGNNIQSLAHIKKK